MARRRQDIRELRSLLDELGAQDVRVETANKHIILHYRFGDKDYRQTLSHGRVQNSHLVHNQRAQIRRHARESA